MASTKIAVTTFRRAEHGEVNDGAIAKTLIPLTQVALYVVSRGEARVKARVDSEREPWGVDVR